MKPKTKRPGINWTMLFVVAVFVAGLIVIVTT